MPLVLEVLAAAQAFEKAGQRLFKPHGLTLAQFNVLNLLAGEADGVRASDLARALIVDASNVTGLLKRMKAEGFLRECENTSDRRQHIVGLTAKGERVWKAAHREYLRSLDAVESTIRSADRKTTEQVLKKMVAAATTHSK
jgi:DNA-binding MarR family transcriptional regulator